jgi:hypothetical protein
MRPFLKGLEAPYAGETPLDAKPEIPAQADTYYPMIAFDVKLLETSLLEQQFGGWTVDPGTHAFFVAKMQFKKVSNGNYACRFQTEVESEDGDRYKGQGPYKVSVYEPSTGPSEFGQEVAGRIAFDVPKGIRLKKLRIAEDNEGGSRVYIFPLDVAVGAAPASKTTTTTTTTTTTSTPATGMQGDDYTTTLKKPDGSVAGQFDYTTANVAGVKKTHITIGEKKAVLAEDASGMITFSVDGSEGFRAPKATGKDPQTSIDYFTLVYANQAAPKPKKNSILGSIGQSILGGAIQNIGGQMVTGAVLAGMGQASAPSLINAAVQSIQGYAVQSFAVELGRAVMTSAKPTEAGGPDVVSAEVKVKDKVYAETAFKQRHAVSESDFPAPSSVKDVDAKELFKQFAQFMATALPSK